MRSSQQQKSGPSSAPPWFLSSKDKLKENIKVTSVRQPPDPKMAKFKVDQSSLIRREVETDHNKHMEALKDEYRANLYCGPQTGSVAEHHQGWEDWRVREQQDRAAVAEVRGRMKDLIEIILMIKICVFCR